MSNLMVGAQFCLGDDPRVITGWHHDHARWNGWACPWVERDQLVVVAALLSSEEQTYSATPDGLAYNVVTPSPAVGAVVIQGGLIEPELVMCADGIERVLFDVGLGCCWAVLMADSTKGSVGPSPELVERAQAAWARFLNDAPAGTTPAILAPENMGMGRYRTPNPADVERGFVIGWILATEKL